MKRERWQGTHENAQCPTEFGESKTVGGFVGQHVPFPRSYYTFEIPDKLKRRHIVYSWQNLEILFQQILYPQASEFNQTLSTNLFQRKKLLKWLHKPKTELLSFFPENSHQITHVPTGRNFEGVLLVYTLLELFLNSYGPIALICNISNRAELDTYTQILQLFPYNVLADF